MLKSVLSIILTAIAYNAAMPNVLLPYGSPILGLVSLIPLFFVLQRSEIDALPGLGALFGFTWSITNYYWLSNFGDFSMWTLGGVSLVYTGYYAVFFPLLGYIIKKNTPYRILLIPAAWVSFEFLRSIGYLAFPWNLSAHPFFEISPLLQIVDTGGIFLLNFYVVLFQTLVFFTLQIHFSRHPWSTNTIRGSQITIEILGGHWLWFVLISTFIFGYGIFRINEYYGKIPDGYIDIILIQQNQDAWQADDGIQALSEIQQLTLDAKNTPPVNMSNFPFSEHPWSPHLVMWSETSIPFILDTMLQHAATLPSDRTFERFLQELNAPLLTGAPLIYPKKIRNRNAYMNGATILSWDSKEGITRGDWYGKRRLIPFAEHVPLGELPFLSDFLAGVVGLPSSGWAHGPDANPISITYSGGIIQAGTPICFEDSFFQVTREQSIAGADIFLNLTNNSWSKTIVAQTQHLVSAIFRTIETRRPEVRSTHSGVTGYINTTGEVQYSAPMFTKRSDAIRINISTSEKLTFYTRFGDFFPMILIYGLWLFIIFQHKARKHKDISNV